MDDLLGFKATKTLLGICVLGLLAALFLTPLLDSGAQRLARFSPIGGSGIDTTVTGSIKKANTKKRYIIRRSVMQKQPAEPCYIYEDGTREGGC